MKSWLNSLYWMWKLNNWINRYMKEWLYLRCELNNQNLKINFFFRKQPVAKLRFTAIWLVTIDIHVTKILLTMRWRWSVNERVKIDIFLTENLLATLRRTSVNKVIRNLYFPHFEFSQYLLTLKCKLKRWNSILWSLKSPQIHVQLWIEREKINVFPLTKILWSSNPGVWICSKNSRSRLVKTNDNDDQGYWKPLN